MSKCTLAELSYCNVENCSECARLLAVKTPLRFITIKHPINYKKHGWHLSWILPPTVELGFLRHTLRKERAAMEKARRKRGQLKKKVLP